LSKGTALLLPLEGDRYGIITQMKISRKRLLPVELECELA
jgi:hypothetical protein